MQQTIVCYRVRTDPCIDTSSINTPFVRASWDSHRKGLIRNIFVELVESGAPGVPRVESRLSHRDYRGPGYVNALGKPPC